MALYKQFIIIIIIIIINTIEVFTILHSIYDPEISLKLNYNPMSNTEGNKQIIKLSP